MAECFELTGFQNSIKTECRVSNHRVHDGSLDTTLSGVAGTTDVETGTLKNQDFFTKCNVLETKMKSKKSKRKRNASKDLMDVVNSELKVLENPIMRNIVNTVDYTKFDQNFHINNNNYSSGFSSSKLRRYNYGNTSGMNPVFPSIYKDFTADNAIVVQYSPPSQITDFASKNEDNEKQDVKFLDIELSNIKIKHHHIFSLEELLMAKLLEIYDEYKIILSKLHLCLRTTKVNRDTKNNLKEKLLKVSSKKENVLFDTTFRKYVKKLLDSKDEFLDLTKKNKEIINKIVSLWSDIKMVQEKTGTIRTIYEMNITNNVLDEDEYQQKWKDMYYQEIKDITDKIEYDFVTKYIEYKQEKYENKNDKNTITHKPKLVIDDHIVNENIERLLEKIVCKEEIELVLRSNEKLKNKKKSLSSSTSYKFMILVDNNFVCESDHYTNNDKFVIDFVESYSIQILPHNKYLTITLLENDQKYSSHTISLSEIKIGIQNAYKKKIEFQCNSRIEPSTKNVGSGFSIKEIAAASGVRLKSSNLFKDQLYTKYEVNLHVSWSGKFDENNRFEFKKYVNISHKINKLLNTNKKPSFDILKEVIEHIYEKDASGDSNLIHMLKKICDTEIPLQNEEFTIENIDLGRLKLLHLRNNNNYSDVKIIPLISTEISTKQLNLLKNMGEIDPDNTYFDSIKKANLDRIEIERYIGLKYIANLNNRITKKCNVMLLKKTYRDVVCNFKDLCLRSILHEENNSMAKDSTNGIGQFLNHSHIAKEQELMIVIHRAFNLPDRTKSILSEESLDEEDSEHVAGVKMKSLRTFVRVTYKDDCVQTTTAIGCYPSWNETLQINIKDGSSNIININLYDKVKETISEDFPEENSSLHSRTVQYKYCNKWLGSLQIPLNAVLTTGKLQGTFKINTPPITLGYENTTDQKSTSQNSASEISRCVKDSAFLSLQIYAKFVPNTNKYSRPAMNNDDDYIIKHLNEFIINYSKEFPNRNLILTFIDSGGQNKCVTQFLQPIIPPDWAYFPKNPTRLESALSKTSAFSKSSSSNQGKTEETKEIDVERAESTTPSYGRASDYWATDREIERMICCCLRYVTLIPTYDAENYAVTLMGEDLLKVLHGSPLDHTLLLANYFIYLGIKCWVVFGSSLRGPSTYVLVKYNTKNNKIHLENDYINEKSSNKWFSKGEVYSWFIFDALTAEKYEIRDISCPLKTIYYVFNNENIWVNIQSTIACETISLDFSKSSEWQAVFDKSIFVPSPTIISDKKIYTPATNIEALREKMEAKIKLKVQKWRARTKTVWNRYCSSLLRELVPHLECWAFNTNEPKPSLGQRLKQLMVTYKVFGFPLNMPFVNMKTVLAAIKSTALHMQDDPTVEFGLATEMFPYPNNVISVWVFFVSITKI